MGTYRRFEGRRSRARIAWLAAFALVPADALAQRIHKCEDADGHLTYQDEPCPPGTAVPAPPIAPPPAYVPPPPAPAPGTAAAPAEPAAYTPPPPPLPALYRCTRYDGQQSYVTSDPTPRVYQVPLWAVLPDMTASSPGGLTTSRPPRGGANAELLGAYTTVSDTCRPMPRAELCRYWDERRESVRAQAKIAFNDTRPQLEQEQAGLDEQLATHGR
jgi:hypothetical protein